MSVFVNRCWRCMEDMGEAETCPHCGFSSESYNVPPYALQPNTILHGKYLIGSVLGQGGFGITYIGFDLTLEMKVAIKEYFPMNQAMRNSKSCTLITWRSENSAQNWRTGCVQFLSEARRMAKMNSIPEIVSVRDTFEENNTAYIVMDYVPGSTMKHYMQANGLFTYDECVTLMLPVIQGLDMFHRNGVIHRDISPDNLMLSPNGKLYLLDLGAAKDLNDSGAADQNASKAGFSPLEQLSGGAVSPRTDVYALAATIYYCVYGKLVPDAIQRLEEDTLSFDHPCKKKLTPAQIRILQKALSVKPELRYQTAMDFYIALRDSVKRKKSSLNLKLLAAVGGVVAAAAAACALFIAKPWLPTVEQVGPGVSGQAMTYVETEDRLFFTDLDNALCMVKYDTEDECFYVNDWEVIMDQSDNVEDDGVFSIMPYGDRFLVWRKDVIDDSSGETRDVIVSMDYNGEDQQVLVEMPAVYDPPWYAKLSNGSEYYYYATKNEEKDDFGSGIYRVNMDSGKTEELLPADQVLNWFGLKGKYLFYVVWEDLDSDGYLGQNELQLWRANLDGSGKKLLDDQSGYFMGLISDNTLYLFQLTITDNTTELSLQACDDNGKHVKGSKGIYGINWMYSDFTLDNDWLYYSVRGSGELYRCRLDGTDKHLILSGYNFHNFTVNGSNVYFQDGEWTDDTYTEFVPEQAYVANVSVNSGSGANVVDMGFDSKNTVTIDDVVYSVGSDSARPIRYEGTQTDVIIRLSLDGLPVDTNFSKDKIVCENVPVEDVTFYPLVPDEELSWKKTEGGITITGYSGESTGEYSVIALPTEIDGLPVTAIGERAFAEHQFERVYLPRKLEVIGKEAFEECENLEWVIFPETLLEIEDYAFYNCSFKDQEIVIPEGVTELGVSFLGFCEPKSVYLPASLGNSFYDGFLTACSGEYIVSPDNEKIKSENGIVYNKTGTVLFAFPCERTGSFRVPDGVKYIDEFAFCCSNLSEVHLPDSLVEIRSCAFWMSTHLTYVNFPDSIEVIGEDAFVETALTEVYISESLEAYFDAAFDDDVKFVLKP